MILKTTHEHGNEYLNSKDIRKVSNLKFSKSKTNEYIHLFPEFEVLKGKTYKYGKENICFLTPSCRLPDYLEHSVLYSNQYDIRKFCIHLYRKLFQLSVNGMFNLDNLTKLLLENQNKYGRESLLLISKNSNRYIIGVSEQLLTEWVNVYCMIDKERKLYFNYGYNITEKRWKRNLKPESFEVVEEFVQNLIAC